MGWLDRVRVALDAASDPIAVFFRDDDAGWRNDRLRALLELFHAHDLPVDLAVIPAALDRTLAGELRALPDRIGLHQHGFAHLNHEPDGRKFEFGPSRDAAAQREDIANGAHRLRQLLGDRVDPIFTPPWNRCTPDTGRSLLELGFTTLSREHKAEPLNLPQLKEIPVHVDWCRPDREQRLVRSLEEGRRVGVMFHHAEMDEAERDHVDELLALLARHEKVEPRPMAVVAAAQV
jgi:peptidoglycan/xylan/chitin deacetylase (PgdA/CDA1 family)